MSKKERRDGDRRPGERRESQPDDQQQRRPGDLEAQEGDSLTALKAILAKVAGLLAPLQLTPDESTSLVDQLYGSVLETDLRLAGEADDRRKSSVLAHIQNTTIARAGGKISVQYPGVDEPKAAVAPVESAQETPNAAEDAPPEPASSKAAPKTPPAETPADDT